MAFIIGPRQVGKTTLRRPQGAVISIHRLAR
jgi:predicted AAA+ superfamily ATPase